MDEVEGSLKKLASGTTIVLFGTVVSLLLTFISIAAIARSLTKAEYGIFFLAFTIFQVLFILASIGLQDGVARFIGIYRSRGDSKKVRGTIKAAIRISIITSLILALIIYFTSNIISIKIFRMPGLLQPLRIFTIALPFFVLINIFVSIFRGFGNVRVKVIYSDFLLNFLRVVFVVAAIYLGFKLDGIAAAFILLIFIICVLLSIRTFKTYSFANAEPQTKKLLLFSVPLLMQGIIGILMSWTDTIMLGYFTTAGQVGLYNAASPIAKLLTIALASLVFLHIPIASSLYAKRSYDEIRRIYTIVTKWVLVITLPAFFLFFLFPSTTIATLFGVKYIPASTALQILSIGFIVHVLFRPNGATLTVIGKPKILMFNSIVGGVLNILLNLFLIPRYGIEGAALATAISFTFFNLLTSSQLYIMMRIIPLSKNSFKIIFSSGAAAFAWYLLLKHITIHYYITTAISLAALALIVLLSTLITKSLDKDDAMLISMLEEKTGIKLTFLRAFIR